VSIYHGLGKGSQHQRVNAFGSIFSSLLRQHWIADASAITEFLRVVDRAMTEADITFERQESDVSPLL